MDNLINIAIIGTGQAAATPFTTDLPTDALLEPLSAENRERLLLLAAGSASIYRRAAYIPALFPEPLPTAEPEDQPYCSPRIEQYLENLLKETPPGEVLLETLQLMRQAQLLLPARLLPLALDIKKSHAIHRAHIYPLLGKRGLWLSQFQAEWAWVQHYNEQEIPPPSLLKKIGQQECENLVTYNIEHEESWQNLIGNLPKPWSTTFSNLFLQKFGAHLPKEKENETHIYSYQTPWYHTLIEAATAIPPECFSIALEICQPLTIKGMHIYEQRTWNNQLEQFRDIIKMRQQIREELQG
jgi:hypothetical protein